MNKSEKLFKFLSGLIENGVLTSQDLKKELLTNFQFQKDNLVEKLDLVSREEFEVLKKIVQKKKIDIKKLKNKKTKRVK